MKKKRLQSPASSLSANKFGYIKFSRMNSPVKLLTKGGETRLLLERDQKRDQAKGKALEIFPKHFVVKSSTKNVNLDFPLE